MNNINYYFIIICAVLSTIADGVLSWTGVNMGLPEGNPLLIYLFPLIGVFWTMFISVAIRFLLIWFIVKKSKQSNLLKDVSTFILTFITILTVFQVGAWASAIARGF